MKTLNERLDLIKPKILAPGFRKGRGLGNEINFWIFDYAPGDEMAVRSHLTYLKTSINAEREDTRVVVFDLYELMLSHLEEKKYLDKVLQMEQAKGSDSIISPIKKTLRLTLADDVVVSTIAENVDSEKDILFISGVGKAWPFIRSHTVLNNLHSRIEGTPVVMFFPGEYTSELRLFGEIKDDNYYRAFRLIER